MNTTMTPNEKLHKAVLDSIPRSSYDLTRHDGSYYLTDGKTVCTVNVHNCGVIDDPKYMPLSDWEGWYGKGHCPVAVELVESIEKSSHQDSTEKIAKARNKSIETFKKDINKEDVISSPIIESPGNTKSVAKGGNRELIVDGDRATIRTNGKDYDASKVITGLRSNGLEVNNLPKEDLQSLLCGKSIPVPNDRSKNMTIVKGVAGYSMKTFDVAKQINHAAQQEI